MYMCGYCIDVDSWVGARRSCDGIWVQRRRHKIMLLRSTAQISHRSFMKLPCDIRSLS